MVSKTMMKERRLWHLRLRLMPQDDQKRLLKMDITQVSITWHRKHQKRL
jgi:hypothetical protein